MLLQTDLATICDAVIGRKVFACGLFEGTKYMERIASLERHGVLTA
jgi:hypothetical protein